MTESEIIEAPKRPMGLVLDMPFAEYLAVDALSNSDMKLLARSPWHYKNRVPVVETRPMLRGSLAHCAQLEPYALGDRYAFVPAGAPRRPTEAQWNAKKSSEDSMAAKAWWSAFSEDVTGRTVVTAEEFTITQQQLAALGADHTLTDLFATGNSEVSIFWVDQATGVYCKARPDHLHYWSAKDVTAVDLKATADDTPRGFGRTAARMGYQRQRAHYVAGIEAVGLRVREFVFAAVSSAPPVLAVPYLLPEDFAQQGADEVRELIELYAHCVATDSWPSYGSGYMLADIPAYASRSSEVEIHDVE